VPSIGVLTREQNASLAQALAFDRKGRTTSVEELLVGLADKKPRARPIALLTGAIIAAMAALGVIFWALDKLWISRHSIGTPDQTVKAVAAVSVLAARAVSEKSVAVLPFLDMSEKKDQEYFADGMAEEVINLLAKVPDLRVPARTSSFYFKGKPTTIPDIAKALGVSHVLEGSVRKSANKLRVTAQLIRVDNGYHVWSDTYDRKLDDMFEVEDEIAGEVVRALKVSLGANEVQRDAPTKSTEAYELLLKARSLLYRSAGAGPDDCKRAVGYYQQVVQLDPHAAVAWAELSEALLCQGRTVQHVRAPALQAAEYAIAADPLLADAHVAMARIRYWFDWDWAAANVEYEKARELDPANSHALTGAGAIALLRDSLSDAMRVLEQAVARDPLNASAISRLSDIYFAMGQFKDSTAGYRKTLELAPDWPGSHAVLSQSLLALGQQDAALAEIEKELDPGYRAYALARTYIVFGHRADAESALSSYERTYASEQPYNIATLHALRGELDQAFSWLNRAYQQHDPSIVGYPPITVEPDVKNLRGDPRFKAFLRKMNLPE
jgi:TolB-like protein/Tfp pilus assembly protein PilF